MAVDLAELGLSVRSDGVIVASARLDELEKKAKKAETAAERLEKQFIKTGNQMKTVGRNMSMYVTAPIVAAGAASVRLGVLFDSTLTKIHTLAGATREEMVGFRKEILKLAPAVGVGPVALADGLYAVASAGQHGAQAMQTLTQAAKASTLGLGDTRVIALTVTAAMKAYEQSNLSSTKALEILIGTIEQGSVEADTLAPSLGRVIGIAAEMGVTFQDVGAFIAVFTRLGIDADEATTALRGTLSTIQKPAKEAEEAFAAMGTSVEEVRRKIRDEGFINTFQDLVTRSRQFGVDLVSIVPNVRALSGVLGVFGGAGKDAQNVLKSINETVGTFEQRIKTMTELDPSFPLKQLSASAQTLAIELSGELLPSLLLLAEDIKGLIKWFRELDPETKATTVKVLALTAAVGPFLLILGSLVRTVGVLIPLMNGLKLAMLWSPVGLVAGVGSLVALIGQHYINAIEDAITGTKRFTSAIKELGDVAVRQSNLEAVNERIVDNVKRQQELVKEINDITRSRNDTDQVDIPWLKKLQADLTQLELEINHLHDLRAKYESEITAITVDPKVLSDLAESFKFVDSLGAGAGESIIVPPDTGAIKAWEELMDVLDPTAKAMKELKIAQEMLAKAFRTKKIDATQYKELSRALASSAMAFDALDPAVLVLKELDVQLMATFADSVEFVEGLEAMDERFANLKETIDPATAAMERLADARKVLQDELDNGLDPSEFERLSELLEKSSIMMDTLGETFASVANEWIGALGEVKGLFKEGSQEAEALNTVIQALNIVLAIQAIIAQLANGDVYSAIPRAIAVAAMIASMGVKTGATGSGSSSRTLAESQGTGSVLGDTEAQTESIVNATKITADATSELVGINRGMLQALQSLQIGIDGAVVQLSRGAGEVDFGALPKVFEPGKLFSALPLFQNIINKIFGGKSKLIDEGIRILGGTLDDIINETVVEAFRLVSVKKNIFSKTKLKEEFLSLGDELATQFGLVFESIRDTVEQAAIALGIPLDVIQQRLDAFVLATQEISFKDMTADEQKEALLAVFGEIFDDLAGAVVPFIDEFQKVGEGLGETLVRVATSVQVFQEAINVLGFVIDEADPELFAQMAVGLVELVGGVENFIAQFTEFFDKFASGEQKMAFATDQLTRAFDDVGLTIPTTRDGMYDLMKSLDATTESGREQIATLLRLAGVADQYYSALEAAEEKRLQQIQTISDFTTGGSALQTLKDRFDEAMAAARALGASTREYAMIARSFDLQLKRMAAELMISILTMAQQLFGSVLNNTIPAAVETTREVANSLFVEWQEALESLKEFTESILLDEQLTTLTPAEKLAEAQSQYNAMLAAARGGDVDAAAALPEAARALLEEARFMFASGEQYQQIFDQTIADLEGIAIPSDIPETITEVIGGGGGFDPPPLTPEELLLQNLQRFLLALDLAGALRELAEILDVSVIELMERLGIPLDKMVELLGVNLDELTAETAEGLAGVAQLLGADIYELIAALDIGLKELAIANGVQIGTMTLELVAQLKQFAIDLGVDVIDLATRLDISLKEMAALFGISIDDFTAAQFQALVLFSDAIGAGINDVAVALGIELGKIVDATSLLSQAFDLAISKLPSEIQIDLAPLLEAIRNATTDADANVAIQNLGDYILALPPDLAAELLPFLSMINYQADLSEEIVQLQSINGKLGSILGVLSGMSGLSASAIEVVTRTTSPTSSYTSPTSGYTAPTSTYTAPTTTTTVSSTIPRGFAEGGYVDRTGMYQMHAGEFVVNPTASNLAMIKPESDQLSSTELTQIRTVLEDIREQNKRYQEADINLAMGIESGIKQQAEVLRRRANG